MTLYSNTSPCWDCRFHEEVEHMYHVHVGTVAGIPMAVLLCWGCKNMREINWNSPESPMVLYLD